MKPRRLLLLSCLTFLLFAGAAASLPAAGAEEPNPADAPIGTLFRWLNFALVLGGIGYAAVKFGAPLFRSRAEKISATIQESAAAKAEAERQFREAEEKLARLEQEVAELRTAARREASAEAERLRAATREEAAKIARAAQAEIVAAERAARIELKGIAARLAIERADALLRKQMSGDVQASLFRTFLSNLSRSVN